MKKMDGMQMERIKTMLKVEVKDVLAELDFLLKVDQRRDLYEAGAIRRAVHRYIQGKDTRQPTEKIVRILRL